MIYCLTIWELAECVLLSRFSFIFSTNEFYLNVLEFMFFINLQLTHIKMLFCMSNLTSIRPSEYYFYNALCSFLTLESSRHGIKDR